MRDDRPSHDINSLPGPLSEALWSPDFVMQAIEVLPVSLRDGRLWSFRPEHAGSFIVAWPASARPEEVAEAAMVQLELEPVVLHSTSWRHANKEVMLTYIAVVSPASVPPSPPYGRLCLQQCDSLCRCEGRSARGSHGAGLLGVYPHR
jgi:hypothetical protein